MSCRGGAKTEYGILKGKNNVFFAITYFEQILYKYLDLGIRNTLYQKAVFLHETVIHVPQMRREWRLEVKEGGGGRGGCLSQLRNTLPFAFQGFCKFHI